MSSSVHQSNQQMKFDRYPNRGVGRLHYSPQLLGNAGSKWWLVLWCDKEIVKYYRHLYFLFRHKVDKLTRPAWDSHITVIRDEEPPEDRQHLWRAHQDREVEFFYSSQVGTNGSYWWLPVFSPQLLELREDLGLSREPYYPLHLSFGHREEDEQ